MGFFGRDGRDGFRTSCTRKLCPCVSRFGLASCAFHPWISTHPHIVASGKLMFVSVTSAGKYPVRGLSPRCPGQCQTRGGLSSCGLRLASSFFFGGGGVVHIQKLDK